MPTESPSREAQEVCIETMGRLAEFWGFTRTMGRVWCALFLSKDALTQNEIVELLGISTANVSMSLNGLLRWGAVHKRNEKGSRKLHYIAEPEIRKIIRNVVGSRERRELSDAVERFGEAAEIIGNGRRRRKIPEDERFVIDRIDHLENVVRMSNKMLELLLGEGRLDIKKELGELE